MENENKNSGDVAVESPRPALAQDLIYCGDAKEYESLIALIKAEWPHAVFEDGSDEIHEDRFGVTIEGVEQDDFFRFAMKNRFACSCLNWNIATMDNAPHILKLWKSLNAPERDAEIPTTR
jgi:hypothetical protein